jgi:hypothetical protein
VDPIIQFPANSQSLNPYSYLMNNPLSGIDPTGYVGCGDVNIKGGTSGTCTHALEDGSEVEVGYRVSKDGNKATFAATRSTFKHGYRKADSIIQFPANSQSLDLSATR